MNSSLHPTLTSQGDTPLFGLPAEPAHENVLVTFDAVSGLKTIIAIHSTARGPAFGGCRLWHYADDHAALQDALRLSQGMSLKNALADLPFGGGKAVIVKPLEPFNRRVLFCAFGDAVQAAGGRYITAEDVGSSTDDMRLVRSRTLHVSGIPRDGAFGGDPSPKTAWGVFLAIQQALQQHLKRQVSGSTVALQGLGAVGMALAEYLADAGAKLVVADVDPARMAQAVTRLGARTVGVDEILAVPCDVLAPCALGAVLNPASVPLIRAAIICGAANNQLAATTDGDAIAARGVLYLPDFLVNAGGIVSVAREYLGHGDEATVMHEVSRIAGRVAELLERSAHGSLSPQRVAEAWAREKLQQ
jgi:leucine dehydrogenase